MQELVREVRKEMNSTTSGAGAGGGQEDQEELCFEVIATVLEIFGRMDSLVGGVYFHFHSHCDTHRRSSALTNKDLAKRLLSPHTLLSHQYGDYFLRKIQRAPPPASSLLGSWLNVRQHLLVFVVETAKLRF